MTQSAMQLTITIPDGAAPGSILSIPVKGRPENVKATVPEGYGPGDELVLMQLAGTDKWVEESVLKQAEQDAANAVFGDAVSPESLVPPGVSLPEADQGPLMPSGPVAHTVRLETTVGTIDIIVRPDWAPYGARRFLQLAYCGDLDGLAFYRAVRGCLAQFGLPAKRQWPPLPDDPKTGVPFLLGAVCFAAAGESSRKSTLFVCTGDMSHCFGGSPWETPIGAVAEVSLDVLERIETCYGDIAECDGSGPDTSRIHAEGNGYLMESFPKLTFIKTAKCLDWPLARSAGHSADPRSSEVKSRAAVPQPGATSSMPCPMAQSQAPMMAPGMSYTLPAERSFEQQAQHQAQMLVAAAAAKPAEAAPITTSSSIQLVPASFPSNGSYAPPRGGSFVPPPVTLAQTHPPAMLGLPAMGPPLGHPGLCAGPCGPCPLQVRPRGSSLQAPPAPPMAAPVTSMGAPFAPPMAPVGGSLRPMPPGALGGAFNFQGLQMPQLQMPTLGSFLPGPGVPAGCRPGML